MLKLSHILPPDAASPLTSDQCTGDSSDGECPRSIIGALPPSAPLHLAIAHQLGSTTYESFGKHQDEGIDDFTALKAAVNQSRTEFTSKSVLIVASERSKWHESLTLENSSWFQEYGGHPRIADALHRTDIKYCSSAKDALILLTLLHPQPENSSAKGESDASVLTEGVPSLIITWDLLNLFLEPENHENDPDSVGNEKEIREEGTANLLAREVPAKEPLAVRFLDGTSPQDYLSLISALRQSVEQLGGIESDPKPEFVVLEPQMTSTMEAPVTNPVQTQPSTRLHDRKKQQTFNLAKGLYWVLAPGYRDTNSNRVIVSNITVDRETGDLIGNSSQQLQPEQFSIENLSGDNIATFELSHGVTSDVRPWLDREGSTYRWVQVRNL